VYAAILQSIADAKAAARAERDRRAVALLEKYEEAMRNNKEGVLTYDLDYATGEVKALPSRRRGK
jgi:hypothetical protein